MCGIFGLNINKEVVDTKTIKSLTKKLFRLSESRGKEASGYCGITNNDLFIQKVPFKATDLIRTKSFNNTVDKIIQSDSKYFTLFGHSRLVTNGYEHYDYNNQPVVYNSTIIVHNGIIINDRQLWEQNVKTHKTTDLDSEIIPAMFEMNMLKNISPFQNIKAIFDNIIGMTNVALYTLQYDNLFLATNNGSLYYYFDSDRNIFFFASERVIIESITKDINKIKEKEAYKIYPNTLLSINLNTNNISLSSMAKTINFDNICDSKGKRNIIYVKDENKQKEIYINRSLEHFNIKPSNEIIQHYDRIKKEISDLPRCTKCILPKTVPFISFDSEGVCNYCHNHIPIENKGREALENLISKSVDLNSDPNCLVSLSGGRDSSYVLHFLVKELHMKPIAYSYDWGMITDLARRNQSRLCSKLGVEHILISADIRKKREYIRKNVLAWLKKPHLGTVPLFMAGDKQYFYYADKIKKQHNIKLLFMGENPFEKTAFKIEFTGARQNRKGLMSYHMPYREKIKMLLFYGKEYIMNPYYLNSSLLDTIWAFIAYYFSNHNYINLYDYLYWDEQIIEDTLINEYDWEIDPETKTTWRIGDGTAAFYNYIYYTVAGFTENDTFRSNQIREGILSREEALQKTTEENEPRWSSIKWYCDTIGIDFESTIKIINKIPKLYER